jgi:DMSO/TMAO reductase YedYZ heme-binding membrane subunit
MTGRLDTARVLAATAATVVLAVGAACAAGYLVVSAAAPTTHSRYVLWITGRALGLAAYLALWALVLFGLAMRRRGRRMVRFVHPEGRLRAHAALAVATLLLVVGHLSSLALDRYAGVGWWGALVPGMSHYRRIAVGLGAGAFLAMLVIGASASLAGRRGTKHWLGVHKLSLVVFLAVWGHGVFAGSDTPALRPVYLSTGALVAVAAAMGAVRDRDPRHEGEAGRDAGRDAVAAAAVGPTGGANWTR